MASVNSESFDTISLFICNGLFYASANIDIFLWSLFQNNSIFNLNKFWRLTNLKIHAQIKGQIEIKFFTGYSCLSTQKIYISNSCLEMTKTWCKIHFKANLFCVPV